MGDKAIGPGREEGSANIPGANTQGGTLQEARENLQEAIAMVLQANRELVEEAAGSGEIIREPIQVRA